MTLVSTAQLLEVIAMGHKADMIALLTSWAVARTDFQLFGHRICGLDYRHIADSIRNDHIQIVRSNSFPSTRAAYNKGLNCFTIGSNPSENLIVHEATHAINDWYARSLSPAEDEGLAWVAQSIFVCRLNPRIQRTALSPTVRQRVAQVGRMCGRNNSYCSDAVIDYATVIAATLRQGRTPSVEELRKYQQAILRSPLTVLPTEQRVYNRIRRTPIPVAYLIEVQGSLVTS